MRREGRLVEWYADRGFGFLAPDDGGPNVFLHIKSLPKADKRLDIGQAYAFDAVLDPTGRERAENVVPIIEPVVVEKRPALSYLRHLPPFLVIAAFIGIVASVASIIPVSTNWYIIYGVASFGCIIGYWIDKNAAIQKNWRKRSCFCSAWSAAGRARSSRKRFFATRRARARSATCSG